ncbi:MAG: hypothetical protein ACREQH_03210 [Candidatus Binatus sp.]
MNQSNEPFIGKSGCAALATMAIIFGASGLAWPASSSQPRAQTVQLAAEAAGPAASPAATDDDDQDVPTSQVDKYINVYAAMQKDHSLTVEQAALKQGLTVAQFRALENKIEADDTLRERARKALRHAANPNEKESSDD